MHDVLPAEHARKTALRKTAQVPPAQQATRPCLPAQHFAGVFLAKRQKARHRSATIRR
jgi:hypothetical protein